MPTSEKWALFRLGLNCRAVLLLSHEQPVTVDMRQVGVGRRVEEHWSVLRSSPWLHLALGKAEVHVACLDLEYITRFQSCDLTFTSYTYFWAGLLRNLKVSRIERKDRLIK